MNKVEITKRSDDGLTEEFWDFYFYEQRATLYLDHYERRTRPTVRHKFRVAADYSRLARRDEHSPPAEGVPFPTEVRASALRAFTDQLKVAVWP